MIHQTSNSQHFSQVKNLHSSEGSSIFAKKSGRYETLGTADMDFFNGYGVYERVS